MLDIVFGHMFIPKGEVVVPDNRDWFSWKKQPGWFEEDFSKRVIRSIDQAEVIFEEAIKDRFGHGISAEQISTGSKSLICLEHSNGERFNGTMMGDNCAPFLLEIARRKDIKIYLEHYFIFRGCPSDLYGCVTVHGKPVGAKEYRDKCIDWQNWIDENNEMFYELAPEGKFVMPEHIPGS